MRRLSWDEYFIALADLVKERGSCPRIKVGAVIVDKDHQIIATGYNGAPPGMPHCLDVGCALVDGHCKRTAHAEENAIFQARSRQRVLEGARLYTSTYPCDNCTRLAGQHGIREIIYLRDYPNPRTPAVAEVFGMTIRQLKSRVAIRVLDEPLEDPDAPGPEVFAAPVQGAQDQAAPGAAAPDGTAAADGTVVPGGAAGAPAGGAG